MKKLDMCEELNAPEHLSSDVLIGALYVNNGKDKEDKIKRSEQIFKKLGGKKATYVMALLILPQMMNDLMNTDEYKNFLEEQTQRTIH
jgi:hypothetical protein